ncbi:tetratricopeptide repeat protein [Methylobacterium sp. Leaf112]|uniref:tetratricopeptide repeat protein n=1 Tax=Methylobacterium sp. Leaf112 TaxID=1736258 RepID=UPI0012E81CCB|nr:hypothetical protein [Methylobacterium sp. Leaf112]
MIRCSFKEGVYGIMLIAGLACPALAQTQLDLCWDRKGVHAIEKRIEACTALIESGNRSDQGLSQIFVQRGINWKEKNDLDRALADYDKAIEINPKIAAGYANRGTIWEIKGYLDRALSDYDKAIQISP